MSDDLNQPPSHALVWCKEENKIAVVSVKKLCNVIVPDDGKNFGRNKFIQVKKKKSKIIEAILLAFGDNTEMNEAALDADLLTSITHALVLFLNSHELKVVEIDNIQEFSEALPKHHLQFLEHTIYHAKKEVQEPYEEVYIFTLGDDNRVMEQFQKYESNVDSALVRFLDDSSLQVISTKNISEFNPSDRSDFEQWAIFKGKTSEEDACRNIQIMRLGCFAECASFIDSYNKITHALVGFKPHNNKEVISIFNVYEFKNNPPETGQDFDKSKLYSGRLISFSKYSAVQIFGLGDEQTMNFEKIHSSKRLKFLKFHSSIIKQYNISASDLSRVSGSSESDPEIMTDDTSTKRKSRAQKNDKSSKAENSDEEFNRRQNVLMGSPMKDLTNKKIDNRNRKETEEHDALEKRIFSHVSGNKGTNRPTGSGSQYPSYQGKQALRRQKESFTNDLNGTSEDECQPPAMKSLTNNTQRYRKRYRKSVCYNSKTKNRRGLHNQQSNFMTDEERFAVLWPDSDSDDGATEEHSVFAMINHSNDDSEVIRYIHVGWNHKILYADWKRTKHEATDEYSFISHFADALFGRQIFEIFLQIKPSMQVVQQKPRREVTPEEIKVIKQCLKYWIKAKCPELLRERSMDQILRTTRHILSEKISAEFKKYKARKPSECSYMSSENFIRNPRDEKY